MLEQQIIGQHNAMTFQKLGRGIPNKPVQLRQIDESKEEQKEPSGLHFMEHDLLRMKTIYRDPKKQINQRLPESETFNASRMLQHNIHANNPGLL